jgi:hypothetical protein
MKKTLANLPIQIELKQLSHPLPGYELIVEGTAIAGCSRLDDALYMLFGLIGGMENTSVSIKMNVTGKIV